MLITLRWISVVMLDVWIQKISFFKKKLHEWRQNESIWKVLNFMIVGLNSKLIWIQLIFWKMLQWWQHWGGRSNNIVVHNLKTIENNDVSMIDLEYFFCTRSSHEVAHHCCYAKSEYHRQLSLRWNLNKISWTFWSECEIP